jgi:hypothetical protein
VIAGLDGTVRAPELLHGDYIGRKVNSDMTGKVHESNGKSLFSAGSKRFSDIQLPRFIAQTRASARKQGVHTNEKQI